MYSCVYFMLFVMICKFGLMLIVVLGMSNKLCESCCVFVCCVMWFIWMLSLKTFLSFVVFMMYLCIWLFEFFLWFNCSLLCKFKVWFELVRLKYLRMVFVCGLSCLMFKLWRVVLSSTEILFILYFEFFVCVMSVVCVCVVLWLWFWMSVCFIDVFFLMVIL